MPNNLQGTNISDTYQKLVQVENGRLSDGTGSSLPLAFNSDGVTITGTVKANNKVTIHGTLDGDVDCINVTVSKTGNIKGKLKAEIMKVEGKAEGEINITDLLHIKSNGSVCGKIIYGNIQIDDGGKLIGEINSNNKDSLKEEFKDWKAL